MYKKNLFFSFKNICIILLVQAIAQKYLYAVPNAGSLLNFEEEIKKVNILPAQVPEEKELLNGVTGPNGGKILIKGFKFDGQTNGFTNTQLTEVIKDLIGKLFDPDKFFITSVFFV